MWKEVGLIGRDNLLSKQILPRLKSGVGFVLMGQHGIGKSAILEWCYDHITDRKTIVSATWSQTDIFKKICSDWGLDVLGANGEVLNKSRWRVPDMQKAILAEEGLYILIDDIHRVQPAVLQKLKAFRDRFVMICAGVPPFKKEELKRMMWGLKYIEVDALTTADIKRIGLKAAPIIKSVTPVNEAAHASRGIPAHLFHSLRGEITPETAKTREEEVDISPIILIAFAGVMALRYFARGMESSAMLLLSGLGMAGLVIVRFYLFKGMSK